MNRARILVTAAIGLFCLCTASRAADPTPLDDRWLGQAALCELEIAAQSGQYADLEKRVQTWIVQRLCCGNLANLDSLNDLVYVRRACRYLPLADSVDRKKRLSEFLLKNRDVSRLLFRAMQDVRDDEEALKKLDALWEKDPKKVVEFANLAVAFATTQQGCRFAKQPKPCTMLDSFAWYTDGRVHFRYDLKAMPFEIARFLADSLLSREERQWAVNRYNNTNNPAGCYFDVKYDKDFFRKGTKKKIDDVDYTLLNLANPNIGGVCIDQAYYAVEVCKAMGVPATAVIGKGSSGIGHAWVACLKFVAGTPPTAEFDTTTGRYPEQQFFTGEVPNPCGGDMADCELVLVGAAALLPLDRKEHADSATELAAMTSLWMKDPPPAAVDELKKLAAAHNERVIAKKPGATIDADPTQLRAVGKVDSSLLDSLINEAIEHNLAHRQVWNLVIHLRKEGRISNDSLAKFFDVLVDKTSKKFPDYSCQMVMQLVPTFDDAAQREKVYQKAFAVYAKRPDLQGQIMITLGDDLAKSGKKAEAMKCYQWVMTSKTATLADVLLTAARRAESLLAGEKKDDQVLQMYSGLFAQAKRGNPDSPAFRQTAYYRLGQRLAALLDDARQTDAANKVREKLGESVGKTKF